MLIKIKLLLLSKHDSSWNQIPLSLSTVLLLVCTFFFWNLGMQPNYEYGGHNNWLRSTLFQRVPGSDSPSRVRVINCESAGTEFTGEGERNPRGFRRFNQQGVKNVLFDRLILLSTRLSWNENFCNKWRTTRLSVVAREKHESIRPLPCLHDADAQNGVC